MNYKNPYLSLLAVFYLTVMGVWITQAQAESLNTDTPYGVPFKLESIDETLNSVKSEIEDVSVKQEETLETLEGMMTDFSELETKISGLEQAIDNILNSVLEMEEAISHLPPSWDQVLSSSDGEFNGCNSTRFACVLLLQAVRDNGTGLVWERHAGLRQLPGGSNAEYMSFNTAFIYCQTLHLGGVASWRMPTYREMQSLMGAEYGSLPQTHPFTSTDSTAGSGYWVNHPTALGEERMIAYLNNFDASSHPLSWVDSATTNEHHKVLCVRDMDMRPLYTDL